MHMRKQSRMQVEHELKTHQWQESKHMTLQQQREHVLEREFKQQKRGWSGRRSPVGNMATHSR
jgi:hypothetical protein